jgi:hypothetical protein
MMLAPLIQDQERMRALEKFLKNIKRYDSNYLRFYVDVLGFKGIQDESQIFAEAGVILNKYLQP